MNSSSSATSSSIIAKSEPSGERFDWNAERQAELQHYAGAGFTGSEIALIFRISRSAVLGRCHRTGVKLPMDDRKVRKARRRSRAAVRAAKIKTPNFRRLAPDHPSRRSRPMGARAFSDDRIAVAIAARLAGQSLNKSARMVGASEQILAKSWLKKPELVALGRELFERAREAAAIEAAKKREIEAFRRETERLRIERNNAPILARMPERHRTICKRRIAGENGEQIARAFGITRERVRQIAVKWQIAGLIIPEARPPSQAAVRVFGPKSYERAPDPTDFYQMADAEFARAKPRRTMNLSPAERERRAEHMREVSRRRWEARA